MKLDGLLGAAICARAIVISATAAQADKLDDILSKGKLRCGAMLDFPPAGFRDQNNEPAGYDVDY